MANSKISALTSATTPVAGTEVLPIVQSSTTKQVSIANLTAGRAVSALSLTTTSDITLSGAATTNIYAYNPTAASGGVPQSSPRVSFYGSEWNSGTGAVTMSGYWQLQALSNNVASPTSKLSLYLAGNGGTPAEIGYFGSNSTLVLSIAGGASTTVQNSTAATVFVSQPSGKYYLIGQSWNSSLGNTTQTSYIYAATDTNNANPTVEAIILAPSNGSGSQLEGFKFLGNGNANFTTGNLSFGTAAKGVNFTANSAASGMTSQLLNWYEEGTWTPTVTANAGTLTSVTTVGTYTRIGRQVILGININITNNGTGSIALKITGMPYNAAATYREAGIAKEYVSTGKAATLQFTATNTLQMVNYDNTYPGGTGYAFSCSIAYNV